jgi:hypothetical protein
VLRRIAKLKAAMPTERPMRDSVVAHSGKERLDIALLYLSIGDEESAVAMYLDGAQWSETCGDVMGAVVLVKRALKLRPKNQAAWGLYRKLWALMGMGDTPDPIE